VLGVVAALDTAHVLEISTLGLAPVWVGFGMVSGILFLAESPRRRGA